MFFFAKITRYKIQLYLAKVVPIVYSEKIIKNEIKQNLLGGPAPKPVQSYRPPKKTKPDPGKGGGGGGGRSTLEDFPGLPGANFVTSQPAVQSYRPVVQKPKAEPAKQAKKLGGKEDFPGLPTPSRTGNHMI